MAGLAAAGSIGLAAEYAIKTSAVLSLALLAAAAARRRPAAIRHLILSAALIGLLLLPLLSLTPVGWRTALCPGRPRPVEAPLQARPTPARSLDFGPATDGELEPPPSLSAMVGSGSLPRAAIPVRPDASPGSIPNQPVRGAGEGGRILDTAAAVLWLAGVGLLILRLFAGLAAAARLSAAGRLASETFWRALFERFLAIVPLRRQVRLKSHPEIPVPMTWGWRRPVILMPAGAEEWPEEERCSALFHELSHIQRADFLVMLAVRASLALFWWNPLAWAAYRRLRREQEIACDELVLRAGIKPSAYAASLLSFRRSSKPGWNPSAALMGLLGRSAFPERLAAILRQTKTLKEVKMKTRIMLAGAAALAVLAIGTARPAAGVPRASEAAIAAPAPAGPGSAPSQEKGKPAGEKAEAKVAVEPKEKDGPIVLTIVQGGETKILKLDKPLTVITKKDGSETVLMVDGKEIQVAKGEPLRLEIKGGEIQVLREGVPLKIGKHPSSGASWTVQSGTGAPNIVYYSVKDGKTESEAKTGVLSPTVVVKTREPGRNIASYSAFGNKDILEKVKALQEQVQAIKAKKLDLSALEETLNKLEGELKAQGEFKFDRVVGGEKAKGGTVVWIGEGGPAKGIVAAASGERAIRLVFTSAGATSADFERAAAKLRKELPEGYQIEEQTFEDGAMRFTIEPPEGAKADEGLIKKIVESVRTELKDNK